MTLHHAPVWARWVIPPAVFGFGILGCFFAYVLVKGAIQEKSCLVGLVGLPIVLFLLYVAYRGVVLVQFRDTRAAFFDERLFIQRSGRDFPTPHMVSDVVIVNYPRMQIMELKSLITGKRLLAIDHLYPNGMALLRQLKQKQEKPGGAGSAGLRVLP